MAYHIPPEHVKETKEYLDIREINGYTVDMAAFHVPVHVRKVNATLGDSATSRSANQDAPAPISCLVYIGLPENPQFVGPQDPDALARHIVRSRGPSGENKEYVYMLEEALDGLRRDSRIEDDVDEHVADLARRVRMEEKVLLSENRS